MPSGFVLSCGRGRFERTGQTTSGFPFMVQIKIFACCASLFRPFLHVLQCDIIRTVVTGSFCEGAHLGQVCERVPVSSGRL